MQRLTTIRRRLALFICPELAGLSPASGQAIAPVAASHGHERPGLTGAGSAQVMNREQILNLSAAYAAHIGRSEATISNRIVGHARLFSRLRRNLGCTINTANKAGAWFSNNWPADLEWPRDIPRPAKFPNPKEAA